MPTVANPARIRHTKSTPATPPERDLTAVIRERLLLALGEPSELSRVQVKPLWGNRYRANVFVGTGFAVRMAHSYFLAVGDEGEIVSASPPLKREY
jgi:hypothetical protein